MKHRLLLMADPASGGAPAATETPPAAPTADKPSKPIAVDSSKSATSFTKSFLALAPGKQPPSEKKVEDAKPDEAPPKVADKPAPKPPAKPKAPKPQPKPEPVTAEEIAQGVAEGVARGMATRPEPKAPIEHPAPLAPELPPDNAEEFRIIQRIELLHPDRRGLADRYKASVQKVLEYGKKWESENPGMAFDQDDPEHADFIDKVDVDIDPVLLKEAERAILKDEIAADLAKKEDPELSRIKQERKLAEAAPSIIDAQNKAARDYWNELGGEFAGLVDEHGAVNAEKLKALKESDPDAYQVHVQAATNIEIEASAMVQLFKGLTQFDAKNPAHSAIEDFLDRAEKLTLEMPARERLDDQNRPFVTLAKYNSMTPAEREKVWAYTPENAMLARARELSNKAAAIIRHQEEQFNARAKRRGLIVEKNGAPPAKTPEAKAAVTPVKTGGAPPSPSAGGAPRVAATQLAGQKSANPVEKRFLRTFI